jgi:hypothetical protein
MAKAGEVPVPSSPLVARERLEADLPKVLRGLTLEQVGWRRVGDLMLVVPMWGERPNTSPDFYLLRLEFSCYPEWPPSAQFVNPITGAYDPSTDRRWLPNIEGNQRIAVHPTYNYEGRTLQLICSSMTLEFYQIRHGINTEAQVWTDQHRFSATLSEIDAGLKESGGYRGRFQ